MRVKAPLVLFLACVLSLVPALAARAAAAIECDVASAEFPAPYYSVLGSKLVAGNQLWLAVLACRDKSWTASRSGNYWKFRRIDLARGREDIAGMRVSADGTTVYFSSSGGLVSTVDLTRGESATVLKWTPNDRNPQQTREDGVERLLLSQVPTLPQNPAIESELLNRLASEDPSPPGLGAWAFSLLQLDRNLYFPVLQFAGRESVWPAPVNTLQDLVPAIPQPNLAKTNKTFRDQALYGAYIQNGARKQNCTSYVHVVDLQGSWLLEFWLYFPFDVGGLGPHLHDSEHVFIEVSKLGYVRRVVGAGHGPFAGNNIYDATKAGAYLLYLPTFAFIELGKHATAPNLDRNGTFTPGLDENWYSERARIWGVRDVIGTLNNQLLMFDSTMMVERNPQDALGLDAWTDPRYAPLLASAQLSPAQCVCKLVTLPVTPPVADSSCKTSPADVLTAPTSQNCALSHLVHHADARNPVAAFKEWYFPPVTGRILGGVGPGEHTRIAGAALAADLRVIPALKKLSLPGRLTTRGGYWQRPGYVQQDGDGDVALGHRRAQGFFVGTQYEQFLTNIVGGYFSGTYLGGDRTMVTTDAGLVEEDTVRGMWFGIGIVAEIPLPVPVAKVVSTNVGMGFRQGSGPRLEFSVNFALTKFGWGHHYGVHADDPPHP